ncbi:MAG: sigma-70 family RNA polymerase sigma factor [Ignavibacteriales bacterium]|nr:sigma-70 family RNA polymerase sigma factor [Ignavibacteriales bacterium]
MITTLTNYTRRRMSETKVVKDDCIPIKSSLDDIEILKLCIQGSKRAYDMIVKRYMKRAYFAAFCFVGDKDAALDLSQDAFIRAYRSIKKFDIRIKFFTYYYQILKNLCFNFLRDKKKHTRAFSEVGEEIIEMISDNESYSNEYEKIELKEKLWKAINALDEMHREIIILKEFNGLSYNEIAELLNIPIGTVMSRLYHARMLLRKKLIGGKL